MVSVWSQVSVLALTFCGHIPQILHLLSVYQLLSAVSPFFNYFFFFTFPSLKFLRLTCSSAGGHPLCLRCLTIEIWRPKLRWTEQHSSQIRTPRLILVQPGSDRQTEIWSHIKHALHDGKICQQKCFHHNNHFSPGCTNTPTLCFPPPS